MSEIHDDFDSPWKTAIEEYFEEFMLFFFSIAYIDIDWHRGYQFLDKELQQVVQDAALGRRHADKLVQVWRNNGDEEWVLAHVEVQGQHETNFARRMYIYNYRLFDRYDKYVASLVVLGDESNKWRPNQFNYNLWDCKVDFQFPIVKLLDYGKRWAALEADDNPFATVVMAHLKAQETQHNPEERKVVKFYLARRLYERGYDREHIIKLFRFIDWVMKLPKTLEEAFWQDLHEYEEARQMPYVTSVERIGIEKGREEGREEGRQEEAQKNLLKLLQHRFGPLHAEVQARLQQLTVEQIDRLFDIALTVNSMAEFTNQLFAIGHDATT